METWERPSADTLRRAVHTYTRHAYDPAAPIPSAVRQRLAAFEASIADSTPASVGASLAGILFERPPGEAEPARYSLRLGNRHYPHMKLVVDRAPDGKGYLFRADTHDRHVQPAPGSKEEAMFRDLMAKNQAAADEIEAAWEAEGLPTFKSFLRQDLARRAAAAAGASNL